MNKEQTHTPDFRTERERRADSIMAAFRRLRRKAPATTSDWRVCQLAAEQLGMHPNSVSYHVRKHKRSPKTHNS